MSAPAAGGHGPDWVVVLPDHDGASAVAASLPDGSTSVVRHPSGRPWVIAQAGTSRLSVATVGPDRGLVLIGPGHVPQADLQGRLARCWALTRLDRLLAELPGAFHAVLRIGDRQRLQGTATGIRRFFFRTLGRAAGGVTVAADRADLLADLSAVDGAACPVDGAALATRLLEPVPHPLAERALWSGVCAVPAGHFLVLEPTGPARTARWWEAPVPERSIQAGAPALREALVAAVRLHVSGQDRVSTELSGGLDSTSVTALAAQISRAGASPAPLAITAQSRDPLDEDAAFAAAAARELPGLRHHVVPARDLPYAYAGLRETGCRLDEPSTATAHRARVLAVTAPARADGSQIHLTGHGGDYLFVGLPTLCVDLLRTHPVAALRRMDAYRGMFGWPVATAVRQLVGPLRYPGWLAEHAVTTRNVDLRHPLLSWGIPATLRPWFTPDAVATIRTELHAAATDTAPLADTRGRHLELDGIREGARTVRALAELTGDAGLPLGAPLLDDRVVEAALAVNLPDRVDPWRYKPLLRSALGDDLPPTVAARTTKGVGSLDDALGLAAHRDELVELWSGSRLGAQGLVDDALLRRLCGTAEAPELADGSLLSTIACELWLRSLERPGPRGAPVAVRGGGCDGTASA